MEKLSLDETENPDNKIVINKYDNKIQKLKFITDATLPPRLYCAFKKPSSLNEYFIIPLTKNNEIIIGTDISSYDGRWDMILIGTSNNYVIEGNDIDQSKLTYVSDTFTRLLVRDNFLNELDSGEHTSPTFDILYDEFRDDIEGKVNLPKDSNGNLDYGTDGQIGVSDGNGGIKWRDEVETDAELSIESENPIQNKVITKEINDLKKDIETKQEKGDYALKSDIPIVTIDSELSNTSENPLQNKAIKKELDKFGDLIDENVDAIDALETVASGKADKVHSHEIADVNGLQSALDEICTEVDNSIPFIVTVTTNADGTNSMDKTFAEISEACNDTSRVVICNHITSNGSRRELHLAGSNSLFISFSNSAGALAVVVTLTKMGGIAVAEQALQCVNDTRLKTNDKTVYGAINEVKANFDSHTHTIADVTDLQSTLDSKASSGHGHDVATTSADGFMSAAMVSKLNGIDEGANKTIVDSSLSSTSTNPIQNKVITTAINNAVSAISTNTSSIESHTQSIAALQSKLDSSKLSESINTALAQAKASGEFKGDKGDTPQKGTDYFTEADKQAFVTDVINALPTWQGGAY